MGGFLFFKGGGNVCQERWRGERSAADAIEERGDTVERSVTYSGAAHFGEKFQ